MIRYNHGMIEGKWRSRWAEGASPSKEGARVLVRLIPKDEEKLDLENARIALVSHFLASVTIDENPYLSIPGASENWLKDARRLGLRVKGGADDGEYDLAILSRDYVHTLSGDPKSARIFLCGRLLETEGFVLRDLLPDFGVDAFRVYFLFLGPLQRDYIFRWQGLATAHRFVARIWQLAQTGLQDDAGDVLNELKALADLRQKVQERLGQRKPHTALSAIMGYTRHRSTLTRTEVLVLAKLLRPFTPFLSAELLELVTAV